VKKYKVNVIHAHDYLPGQIAALTGILSGTPTIVTFHLPVQSTTFHLPSYLRSSILIENLFQRFFNFWVSSIICVSKFTYNDAIKIGFPTSKLRVIYNWATFSELAIKSSNSILLEIRNLSGKPYILAVGHLLEKQKRFSLLIQAFNQLLKKGYALTLVIVGDGPDKDTYEKYAASNNIADKILFINNVSDENLIYLYQNCEVFVIPSFLEGMPLVLLEAMCFGKPIVATAFGGVAEAIQNGFNGFLVNHDPRSVSEGIEKIIVDPNLKVIFGERSKQIIYKKFSHKNLNATLLLLEGLSDKNNKKR
jgi:glycosyltransferase involved in cell wall biosynthesis